MGMTASERFERWKARRAGKAANPGEDELYGAYLDAAIGATAQRTAGQVNAGEPGGADLSEASDAEVYATYRSELSGKAARKRAEANARQEPQDRREE